MTQLDTVTFSEKEKGRILSAMVAYEKKGDMPHGLPE